MVWQLVALHAPEDPPVSLPHAGVLRLGRRPANDVVCVDQAVSGQHCVLHVCRDGRADALEVEDLSTNGTWVNDAKLCKGQRQWLASGDVLSLTKIADEDSLARGFPLKRVQYRVDRAELPDAHPPAALRLAHAQAERSADIPPTAPDGVVKDGAVAGACADANFNQDLLIHEQQSKAKLTAELLASQSKLEDERSACEQLTRDLKKVRLLLDEERAARQEADEARGQVSGEAEALRTERRQLQELTASHGELKRRRESTEGELQARRQRCAQLEADQAKLQDDLQRETEELSQSTQRLAEATTRARQAQERAERLEQQLADAGRLKDFAAQEGARLCRELEAENAARRELDKKAALGREQGDRAEAEERAASGALEAAAAARAELECEAAAAQAAADAAQAAAHEAARRLSSSAQRSRRLKDAGRELSREVGRRVELLEKALADGCFKALEDAFSALDAPTVASVTCRVGDQEDATQQQEASGSGSAQCPAAPVGAVASTPTPIRARGRAADGPDAEQRESLQDSGTPGRAEDAGHPPSPVAPSPPPAQPALAATCPAQLQEEDEEDDLLEAVSRDIAAGTPSGASAIQSAKMPSRTYGSGQDIANGLGSAASRGLAATAGCSTAWSLEVLDADEELPAAKRAKQACE